MDTVSKLSRYAEKISSDIRVIGIPKQLIMTLSRQITHRDLEVPQNTSLLLCGRLLSTHPFMTTKIRYHC